MDTYDMFDRVMMACGGVLALAWVALAIYCRFDVVAIFMGAVSGVGLIAESVVGK